MAHDMFKKGARVWIPHSQRVWEGASLVENYIKGDIIIKLIKDCGETCEIQIKNENDLPLLRNPAILIGQNDLTALSYLNEADVLYNLEVRFVDRQSIYTYCGIVLIAINPYAELPLYGSDILRAYRGHTLGELEPHIFAVAEEAYAKLEREKCDISIIISGESGAGKTVSAKHAMRYFTAVGGNDSETQIECKVLASSPIMEAIGNAKTMRNDNSSRFGKFIKLFFTNTTGVMALTGGTMKTYLLEKSRVVFQATGERNYHIFYQLCAARHMWPELKLDHQDRFKYLKNGYSQCHVKVRDLDKFLETTAALTALGVTTKEISDIMTVLAGILHLGNVKFFSKHEKNSDEIDLETCDISIHDVHLKIMSDVLQLNASELHKWLTNRQIESVNESVLIPKNIIAAEEARDALAKHVYSALFQHIVDVVNTNLVSGKEQNCFIGVLDIYGFETFETNSFEQFCINYANEKLQQQFNQHVFKLEQDEYMKEGIAWTMIDFYDNQPCINLIEAKLGILDLLDEECRVPMGSDESWVAKLVEKCSQYKHFERPRFGKTSFVIKHFSDCVQYDARGFLDKNRDTISKELVNVIKNSKLDMCRTLVNAPETRCPPINQTASLKHHKQSVGSQFRDSLSLLISTLHSTTPHYIRCIKPNEEKAAFKWEPAKIVQQLRACGVLETVRISAAGFPSRCSYIEFYARYRLLYRTDEKSKEDIKSKCKWIVIRWITNDDKYRFGQTQIFFRAGQVAYLEQIRADRRKIYIIKVQSVVRCFIYRTHYRRLIKTALCIQRLGRGWLARRKALLIRETRASVTIQKYFRGYLCRKHFLKLKYLALCIQTYIRGILARRKYKIFVDNLRATQIQKICRAYLARQLYKKKLHQIIVCQSTVRRFLAKQIYKKMKKEARTISHIEKMYKGLEKKIISLQQRYDELNKENLLLTQKNREIPTLRSKIEGRKNLENELKNMKFQLIESENAALILAEQLDNERLEKLDILSKKQSEEKAWRQEKLSWNLENEELKKQYGEILEIVERQKKIATPKSIFSHDNSEEIHQAYQRVIAEKERIEEENCALKEKIIQTRRTSIDFLGCQSDSQSLTSTSNYDDDLGYSFAKNSFQLKQYGTKVAGGSINTVSETMDQYENSLPFKNKSTALVLKLKNLLVYEKNRTEFLSKQLLRLKTSTPNATEDSLRISELEVENAKLRQDYALLRNSIDRGVMQHEIEAQYTALQNELQRRQDECIQLRAALAQQIQSIKTFEAVPIALSCSEETMQAFQSQKHVIRQLESELTAITAENNANFVELQKEIEELRSENNCLQTILTEKLDNTEARDVETLSQTNHYLRLELEKACRNYAHLQEQFNNLTKLNDEVKANVRTLTLKLCDQNEKNSILNKEDQKNMAEVIKKPHVYQGIFKYSPEDVNTIIHRLMIELTPRIAVGLLPGLPAYIIFMCIRYTDLLNTEKQVKTLLTSFVRTIKKLYRLPNSIDNRILWLVNTIKLHNLLKQYGGIDEYLKLNTSTQNQQQLKNFDLSEYRQVIYENIINLYRILVLQVQELIKPYVVPAILDHDEMSRGRIMSLNTSSDPKPEPKSLVNQLENIYKQLQFFGLDSDYIQQIFKQLVYYISGVSLNSIMLRQEFCMWKTGMKIRYNVGCLEDWARNKKMPYEVLLPIQPLIQVSSLLQSRKSEEDVDSIIELCTSLTAAQVLKIIKSYYPDDCENAITPAFVTKLSKKLNERQTGDPNDKFTTDENYIHSLTVVFKRCDIKLEDIELPAVLKLNGLLEKI